ncbi:MAG: hypothetical protein AAGE96_16385 [Cyanobacteria bacterium P01_G01_bin.19]
MASRYRRGDAFTTAPVGRVFHPHGNQVTDTETILFSYSASYPQAFLLVSAKRVARMATIREFYSHILAKTLSLMSFIN